MDKNAGYEIKQAVLFDNGRGVALGENPKAPDPFVTWMFTQGKDGGRDYEWGHYRGDRSSAEADFSQRVKEYMHDFPYKAKIVQIEAPGLYKYYSTQRPVDIGTFPKPHDNRPDEIVNFDRRVPVEGGAFLAWGYLTYTKPLTRREASDYELRPAPIHSGLWREDGAAPARAEQKKIMEEQTQAVGKWEDDQHIPDNKRVTWFYPDFGSYVLKEYVTPEELTAAAQKALAAQVRQTAKRPIAEQMKEAAEQASRENRPPAPGKDTPDREGR